MAADSPERFVATITKSKRRGKILVDYLRNGRGSTAVAAYSTRARSGAPVSMPLAWDELGPGLGPAYFTVDNTPTRLAHLTADPWSGFRGSAVPLPAHQIPAEQAALHVPSGRRLRYPPSRRCRFPARRARRRRSAGSRRRPGDGPAVADDALVGTPPPVVAANCAAAPRLPSPVPTVPILFSALWIEGFSEPR